MSINDNEKDFPANVKVELAKLRQANTALNSFLLEANNKISKDEIIAFDLKNATIVDDETGEIANAGTLQRTKANTTTDKLKTFASTKKYWLIGGFVFLVIVIFGIVYYLKKRS